MDDGQKTLIGPRDPVPARGCFFLGGLVGGLFGGGGSQSTTVDQNTTVNVNVEPQIGIAVDTTPIADVIAESGEATVAAIEAGQADVATVVAAGQQQTQALAGAVLGAFEGLGKTVLLIAAAGGAAFLIMRK
jgi:hypothetical protein